MQPDRSSVPDWLRGCWRRDWIEFADGTRNDSDAVFWLQTDSAMADVRIVGSRPSFTGIDSLSACSPELLAALTTANASTGFTTAVDLNDCGDGTHICAAEWFTYGHGVNFQPVCSFPEPGLLSVDRTATVMIERAPSGQYVEQWSLVAGSRDEGQRSGELGDGRLLFVAGPVAVVVRDRRIEVPRIVDLGDLAADPTIDRDTLEAVLDCEFSVAMRGVDGEYRIVASTLPWREGATLDIAS